MSGAFMLHCCKPLAELSIDIETVSEANVASHRHWVERHKRAKSQVNSTIFSMRAQLTKWVHVRLPLHIVIERRSSTSSKLDDGNLGAALKHVQDGVADALGLYLPPGQGPRRMSKKANAHFDDSDRLSWSYRFVERAEKDAIVVRIYEHGAMAKAIVNFIEARGVDEFLAHIARNPGELDKVLP